MANIFVQYMAIYCNENWMIKMQKQGQICAEY